MFIICQRWTLSIVSSSWDYVVLPSDCCYGCNVWAYLSETLLLQQIFWEAKDYSERINLIYDRIFSELLLRHKIVCFTPTRASERRVGWDCVKSSWSNTSNPFLDCLQHLSCVCFQNWITVCTVYAGIIDTPSYKILISKYQPLFLTCLHRVRLSGEPATSVHKVMWWRWNVF